jgi:2-dehydropantoate 2-reductase
MRILVLGAGGTGGYFGGRLAAAGRDVQFLVREARAAQLAAQGLRVKSPFGDLDLPVRTVTATTLAPQYDLILLSCKAYDLDGAMDALAPGLGPDTLILPLLNGLRHMPLLDQRFERAHVLGGLCHIAATLNERGEVLHLNRVHLLTLGARSAQQAAAVGDLERTLGGAGFEFKLSHDIERELWAKFVFLTTLAAMTCLMRGAVGEIMATRDGKALMNEVFDACLAVAAAAGFALAPDWQAKTRAFLTDRASLLTASMLRDLEAGGRTEADHILGDMVERAAAASIAAPVLRAAYCHLQTYAGRRAARA